MPKVKANKVARSPSSIPYETREATKVVLTKTVRSMRKNGPVNVHFLKRREADECRPLVEGGDGYEKTPTTFLFSCATVVSPSAKTIRQYGAQASHRAFCHVG